MKENLSGLTIVGCLALLLYLSLISFFPSPLHSQVTLDGTLGTSGSVNGPNYNIGSSLGQLTGSNLFFSFGTFNIMANESATFSGPASVTNVISRITGGSASTIDGKLSCTISGANFFLINPYGIVFGKDAALDVKGSFYATTANYILLGDGGRFDASKPENSVLTVAPPPSAFGFLDMSHAGGYSSIKVDGAF
ncbi:MAG: filamentous hemagglutinin N-terminal domain-containing protein [Nitrospirae bacterium]|nr:filamentous hemagglutinin N-terminal domain-containing protein [Nitrospirota bacterium]